MSAESSGNSIGSIEEKPEGRQVDGASQREPRLTGAVLACPPNGTESVAGEPAVGSMHTRLANDRDGALVRAWRKQLVWEIKLTSRLAESAASLDARSRHEWHVDAMRAACNLLPGLRHAAMEGAAPGPATDEPGPAGVVDGPSPQELLDIGRLAWELRFEADALRILGGVGGLIDGGIGRAILQAGALMKRERLQEASAILDHAVRSYGDPRGEASATLAMLWRALSDPAWEALARRVAEGASDESARRTCAEALKTVELCPIRLSTRVDVHRHRIH